MYKNNVPINNNDKSIKNEYEIESDSNSGSITVRYNENAEQNQIPIATSSF